jgi:hypothetical protein
MFSKMEKQEKLITRREALIASGIGLAGSMALLTAGGLSKTQRAAASAGQPMATDAVWKKVAAIFGVPGTIEPGDVLLIELPRTDIHATIEGVVINPNLALDTEITFQHIQKDKAIVKYEFVLLDSEVSPVLDALFAQNLQPTTTTLNALHNHFLEMNPHIKYLHGTSIGDPLFIATALKKALSHSGTPLKRNAAQPATLDFNAKQIEHIIGGSGMISGGVLSVSVERAEKISELGVTLQPAMQIESMFNFQSIGHGRVAEAGEFVLLPQEVDAVARSLRAAGFPVTAVHNHELFIEPNLYYLHTFKTGNPVELAEATRKALNHTHSKFQ